MERRGCTGTMRIAEEEIGRIVQGGSSDEVLNVLGFACGLFLNFGVKFT